MNRKENNNLSKIVQELTDIIKGNNEEIEGLREKNSSKLEQKYQDIMEVQAKLYDKEK